jgi:hypothetical protein
LGLTAQIRDSLGDNGRLRLHFGNVNGRPQSTDETNGPFRSADITPG